MIKEKDVTELGRAYGAAARLKLQNVRLLSLLRDLYHDANPTFLDDADTGVRLSPEWNERILKEIKDIEK